MLKLEQDSVCLKTPSKCFKTVGLSECVTDHEDYKNNNDNTDNTNTENNAINGYNYCNNDDLRLLTELRRPIIETIGLNPFPSDYVFIFLHTFPIVLLQIRFFWGVFFPPLNKSLHFHHGSAS